MNFDLVLRKFRTILLVQEIREPNHTDHVISEGAIIKFQYFFSKFTKKSTFKFKDIYIYVLIFVKISNYHKNMPYIYPAYLSQIS